MPAYTGDATSVAGAVALTLATVNSNVGTFGSATQVATVTVNAKGLTTAASNVTITPAWSSVTSKPTTLSGYAVTAADVLATLLTVDGAASGLDADLLDGQQGSFYQSAANLNAGTLLAARMPAYTGDATSVAGAVALTLATVNSNVGTFGSATQVATVTVNAKGLTTAASNVTITPAWSSVTSKPTTLSGYAVTAADVLATLLTVDGASSGLDADTVDGIQASSLTRFMVNPITSAAGMQASWWDNPAVIGVSQFSSSTNFPTGSGTTISFKYRETILGIEDLTYGTSFDLHKAYDGFLYYRGYNSSTIAADAWAKIWTDLNDGASSGLDADLLDGQQGSFYQSAANLNAGTLLAARMPAYTGDATSVAGAVALTLATVNSNVGTFGSATQVATVTVNAKGLTTAASNVTITPAWSSVTSKPTTLSGYSVTAADVLATLLTVDSASSGLDADLLDGQQGSFYQSASNLNTGTLPDARLTGTYTGISVKMNAGQVTFGTPSTGTQNSVGRVVYNLASYRDSGSAATGAIVFIAPTTATAIMHRLTIEGQLYSGGPTVHAIVQGYRNGGTWSNTSKVNLGITDIQVRFAVTSDGKQCVILGDVGTVWSYGHLAITNAMLSHSVDDAYCVGWTTALETSLATYTNVTGTIANNWGFNGTDLFVGADKVWDAGNDGAASGLDADLLDGQQGSYYQNAGNLNAGTILSARLTGTYAISVSGSAATLTTARTIGGVSFDGSANINLPGVNTAGNQNTTGSAATLTTGRTIAMTGDVTWNSGAFNGSANVTAAGTLATVNSNVGSFGSNAAVPIITVNAKGLVTAVSTTPLGTAAIQTVGTIGGVVPLLNGANTWSKGQVLYSDVVSDSWTSFGLQVREVNLVAAAQSVSSYAPSIAFHWSGRHEKRLLMNAAGSLVWEGNVTANGTITGTEFYSGSGNYFRAGGTGGFYCQTYDGGWNMTDSTWIRSIANKGIITGGAIQGATVTATSDRRLKSEIQPLTNFSEVIDSTNVYSFIKDGTRQWGVLAQEVLKTPAALLVHEGGTVFEDGTPILTVDFAGFTYALLAEVKELRKRVALLEKK